MLSYYDGVVALSCAALAILMVLIHENARLMPEAKKRFYRTYRIIILGALTECLSVHLNGGPEWTRGLHAAAKGLDYVFTPIVGIAFIQQISEEGTDLRFIFGVLLANTLLQAVSAFTGWVYTIDAGNFHRNGPGFPAFILIYAIVVLYVARQFYLYSKRFHQHSKASLYLIVSLAAAGMLLQEATDEAAMVSYLSLALGSILLFIRSDEFNQLTTDDTLSRQRALIETDALTGMNSRYAYSEALTELGALAALPEDTTVFMIDINGLKAVNDTWGHRAGDELIAGMARCVMDTFLPCGRCYRTGGDEFVAIVRVEASRIPQLSERLERRVSGWTGTFAKSASLSCGWVRADEYPQVSIEKLVSIADERMYASKAQYYQAEGRDRRHR